MEKELYSVIKFFRVSGRRKYLAVNKTKEEAQRIVNSYPDRAGSLVGFAKQNNYSNRKIKN